jgi:4-amino-4-deoxy-L-arabinose transferase-like glycosyltransferase
MDDSPRSSSLPQHRAARVLFWIALFGVVLLGMALRVGACLEQGSLHMDEAAVSRNILERSYMGLTRPLDYVQASPLMHLWITKASVDLLGLGEWQLRLPALAAGCLSVPLFALLALKLLRPKPALLAMLLFAVLPALIYYSAFTKSYTFDISMGLAMVLAAMAWHQRPDRLRFGILIAGGMLASWFSYAAPMVLGGVGIALGIDALIQRRWRAAGMLAICGALWLASFAVVWFAIAGKSAQDPGLHEFWKNAFVPLFPRSGRDVGVMVYHYFHLFESPFLSPYAHPRANLTPFVAGLIAALALVGGNELWRRNRVALLMLAVPVLLTLVASSMHRYPFRWRFLLFLAPAVVLTAGMGMQTLGAWAIAQRRRLVAYVVPSVIVLIAAATAAQLFFRYTDISQMHPVLVELAAKVRPGDTVLVHDQSVISFEFYRRFFPECRLNGVSVVHGAPSTHLTQRISDVDQARGRARVWYVYESEWTFYPDFFPELGIWSALAERDGAAELDRVGAGSTTAALFDYSHTLEASAGGER